MFNKSFDFIRVALTPGAFMLLLGMYSFRMALPATKPGPAVTANVAGSALSGEGELVFIHPSKKYSIYYEVIFTTVDDLVIGQGKKIKEVHSNGKTILYTRNPPVILGGLHETNLLEMTMEEEGFNKKVYETFLEFPITGRIGKELKGTYSNEHGSGQVRLVLKRK